MSNSEKLDLGLINYVNDYCEDLMNTHRKFDDSYEAFVTEQTYERILIILWQKKKVKKLFSVLGLEFPKGLNNFDFGAIIRQRWYIVKNNV